MARIAASLIFWGVSKSGSPAERLMTFFPAAFRARAFAVMAMVWDGAMRSSRSAVRFMVRDDPEQKNGPDPTPRFGAGQPAAGGRQPYRPGKDGPPRPGRSVRPAAAPLAGVPAEQVQRLHQGGEGHGGIDIALRHMRAEAFGDQRH